MAEGFDPSDAPVRRGRRDPELQLRLEAGIDDLDAQGDGEETIVGLAVGDEIVFKMTTESEHPINGKDRWFTYGIKTSVQPGEDEQGAFERVVLTVHGRLAEAIEYADIQAQQAEEERRSAPITPRR